VTRCVGSPGHLSMDQLSTDTERVRGLDAADTPVPRHLTEDDVLGWENAGVLTLRDLIKSGNAGIAWHHGPGRDLVAVADEVSHSHVVPDGGSGAFAG